MGIVSKSRLLFHTVKYLKPSQLYYRALNRVTGKSAFHKYLRYDSNHENYSIWINVLDEEQRFINRFKPDFLLHGIITLLHECRQYGKWSYAEASHLWNFNLHYFEYLVALKSKGLASKDNKYYQCIDRIIKDWEVTGSKAKDSNAAYTVSLRIVNMLLVADVVSEKEKLYDYIYAQYRWLLKNQEKHLLGNHYLENLKAIVICSVFFNEPKIYKKYIRIFLKELEEEILSDGLHFELSLMYHKIVLEDVMRVALILRQAGKEGYHQVYAFLEKMVTALYSLEYKVNRTPLFNDAGDNIAKPTHSLIVAAETEFGIKPNLKSNVAGYYKLYDGNLSVIVDCGDIGPAYMPGHSHCDCLSFEVFYEGKPLVVNCGTYQYQGKLRTFFRSTEAHNTVTINGHQQSELWGEHRAARRISELKSQFSGNEFIGSYTNYCGEKHKRRVSLKGYSLEVLDETTGVGNVNSYLHLAPGLTYSETDGNVTGFDIGIKIIPINAKIKMKKMHYAEDFGKLEEIESIIFTWQNDKKQHGYVIKFK